MGTTSEKLTYLNTTKTLIKDNLNLGGANISNEPFRVYSSKLIDIYKDFLANGTDVVWNNWLPKVTGSGENITLNNTIEAKMDFVYKGNTYQYSTIGKNLLNDYDLINRYNIASISDNILTTNEINSDYSVFQPRTKTQKIDLVENTKYYVSFDCRLKSGTYSAKLGTSIINGIDATSYSTGNTAISNPNMSSLYQRYSFECISNITTNSVLGIQIQVRTGLSNAVFEIKNIMISTSSDTTYEPYTGNQPSPSPDYPQDIQVVSGDNTIKVEGKNLASDNDSSTTRNFAIGNVEEGVNYTLYLNIDGTDINGNIKYDSASGTNAKVFYTATGKNVYTFTSSKTTKIYMNSYGGTNFNGFTEIMLVKGTYTLQTIGDYEPYVSQTYPINLGNIELCKIGTYQDKIAKSTGKNLFNKDTIEEKNIDITTGTITDNNYWRLSDYISVIPSTNYMSSMINNTSNQFYVKVAYYDNNKTFISGVSSSFINVQYYGFTTPNNAKYIRFAYLVIIGDIPQNIDNIMINEGSTALPYEPYGKVWYLNKQIGKVVLDGSESWSSASSVVSGTSRFYYDNNEILNPSSTNTPLSNMFKSLTWGEIYSQDTTTRYGVAVWDDASHQGRLIIRIDNTLASSVTNFKTWLSTHNTTVYYVLATPTTTEITDTTLISQLEAIKKSYNTQTNITQENNDLPFELDVVALGELEI